jgi:hypothetical protein
VPGEYEHPNAKNLWPPPKEKMPNFLKMIPVILNKKKLFLECQLYTLLQNVSFIGNGAGIAQSI